MDESTRNTADDIGKKGQTLLYMFYCICSTARSAI